jgi:hypothetical protein
MKFKTVNLWIFLLGVATVVCSHVAIAAYSYVVREDTKVISFDVNKAGTITYAIQENGVLYVDKSKVVFVDTKTLNEMLHKKEPSSPKLP